jgi:hypothetical protein
VEKSAVTLIQRTMLKARVRFRRGVSLQDRSTTKTDAHAAWWIAGLKLAPSSFRMRIAARARNLSLPLFAEITREQQDRVIELVRAF